MFVNIKDNLLYFASVKLPVATNNTKFSSLQKKGPDGQKKEYESKNRARRDKTNSVHNEVKRTYFGKNKICKILET